MKKKAEESIKKQRGRPPGKKDWFKEWLEKIKNNDYTLELTDEIIQDFVSFPFNYLAIRLEDRRWTLSKEEKTALTNLTKKVFVKYLPKLLTITKFEKEYSLIIVLAKIITKRLKTTKTKNTDRLKIPMIGSPEEVLQKNTMDTKEIDPSFFEEERAFLKTKKSLYKKYKGKYVAVKNGKVVDSDENSSKLAERVYRKFKPPFYIDKIITEENISCLLSPKIDI